MRGDSVRGDSGSTGACSGVDGGIVSVMRDCSGSDDFAISESSYRDSKAEAKSVNANTFAKESILWRLLAS